MKRNAEILISLMVVLIISRAADAQGSMSSRSGRWNLGAALGIMVDPDLAGGQLGIDYYVTNEISIGPLIIAGVSGNDSLWGLSGQVKYSARLAENDIVRPYGHVGIGFVNIDLDSYRDGRAATRALFPVGGGFEFELNDNLTLDTNALFVVSDITSVGLFCGVKYLF